MQGCAVVGWLPCRGVCSLWRKVGREISFFLFKNLICVRCQAAGINEVPGTPACGLPRKPLGAASGLSEFGPSAPHPPDPFFLLLFFSEFRCFWWSSWPLPKKAAWKLWDVTGSATCPGLVRPPADRCWNNRVGVEV